ncbi:MAG: hypothetical protein WCI97_04685, partial [Bacteroidota bacterium]
RTEKLKLQPIVSIENPKRTQLFFSPITGWNNYDKGMVGLAFYNSFIPSTNFHFVLAPMYSFATKQMTGIGRLQYYVYPKSGFIKNICLNATEIKLFHYNQITLDSIYLGNFFIDSPSDINLSFYKNTIRADLTFKNKNPKSCVKKWLTLQNSYISKQVIGITRFVNDDGSFSHFQAGIWQVQYNYYQLKFSFEKQQVVNPFSYYFGIENFTPKDKDFLQRYLKIYSGWHLSGEFNCRFNYKRKSDGLGIRLYADYSPDLSNLSGFDPHLTVTPGSDDYAFDEVFLARSEQTGFLAHQIMMNRGGMKFHNPQQLNPGIGTYGQGIIVVNLTTSLIIPLPIFAFADFGYQFSNPTYYPYKSFQYDGGIGVTVIPDVCTAYLTLFESGDIKLNTFLSSTEYGKWYNRYFFTLNFSKLVPFDKIRNLKI